MRPADVWLSIEGYQQRDYDDFVKTRLICHSIAQSVSDPKKFHKTPQQFMPHPMDKSTKKTAAEIRAGHEKKKADRERLLNGKNIHSTT